MSKTPFRRKRPIVAASDDEARLEALKTKIERHQREIVTITHLHATPFEGVICLGWRAASEKHHGSMLEAGWLYFSLPGQPIRMDPSTGEPIYLRVPLYVVADILAVELDKTT